MAPLGQVAFAAIAEERWRKGLRVTTAAPTTSSPLEIEEEHKLGFNFLGFSINVERENKDLPWRR